MMNNTITNGIEAAIAKASPVAHEGDYTSPAGLLICGKCGQPRQCRIQLLGKERIVSSTGSPTWSTGLRKPSRGAAWGLRKRPSSSLSWRLPVSG